MSLTPCQDCVLLAKASSAYCAEYACGSFARRPCPDKDLGQIPSKPNAKSGIMIPTQKIKDNFSRAAVHYEKYADIQAELAEELLEEALGGEHSAESILDIGCGSGWLLEQLERYFQNSKIFGLDLSFEMIKRTKRKTLNAITADARSLPFKDESFDLVLSNAVYQWVFDLDTAFREAARVLSKGGCLMFNCFGAQTLEELRNCFSIGENHLPQEGLIREHLEKAHFSGVELKKSVRKKYFDNLVDILSWLKYIGANRINDYQPFFTPKRLAEANYAYSCNYRSNGKVYVSFEVISVKALKEECQKLYLSPQPILG